MNNAAQHQGTAVITGASGGIGAVYADRLARRGYDLIIVARHRDRLNQQASRISAETGRSVEVAAVDLNDPQALRAFEATLRQDASVTLLVNNAGVGTHTSLLESDIDRMEQMIDLNVIALTRLTYAVVPGMVARGQGAIINIASIVGIAPEILNGAFVLGDAGLLDGKRVTTHWAHAQALEARVPQARVESDRIFITDGAVWTSAGMTAGLDMALGMVEKDLGAEVARAVAHRLVMHHRRSGGQTQHSEMLALSPRSDRIQSALEYARKNLSRALTVDELADVVHLSPRQFSRLFREETGKSPAKAIEGLRLEAARLMIEQSRLSMDAIAREAGFRDRRHMREVFVRGFGVPPQALRQGRSSSRAA
ncbi:SDR family NAD(P)-dependent oxidoreductase [Cronobacter turicensis]